MNPEIKKQVEEFQSQNVYFYGGSVIPAAVKTPDNKLAIIIKPGRNMAAVKTPDKNFA